MYWIIRTKSRECSLFPIIGTKDLSGRSRKPSKNVWRLVEMGWRKKRIWITELEEKIFYYHRLFQLTELSTPSFRILRGSILHCSLPLSLYLHYFWVTLVKRGSRITTACKNLNFSFPLKLGPTFFLRWNSVVPLRTTESGVQLSPTQVYAIKK